MWCIMNDAPEVLTDPDSVVVDPVAGWEVGEARDEEHDAAVDVGEQEHSADHIHHTHRHTCQVEHLKKKKKAHQ